jgi:hypothetical protein
LRRLRVSRADLDALTAPRDETKLECPRNGASPWARSFNRALNSRRRVA